jgi:hypothetical protein
VTRPKYVLLDAGPIIGLHAVGAWEEFLSRYDVVVPETVKQDEALFHSEDPLTGFHTPIDLDADLIFHCPSPRFNVRISRCRSH